MRRKRVEGSVVPPLLIYPRERNTARVKKKMKEMREKERERRRKAAVAHGKNPTIVYR